MSDASIVDEELRLRGARALVRRRRGAGVPLLLVPGCGRDHRAFDDLLAALGGRDVMVPALPGRAGVAGAPPESATEAARFVLEVLDACGVARAVVGGHSYGGRQASILAASEPGLVEALLLLAYPLHPPRRPSALRTAHFAELRTPALFVHGSRDPFGSLDELEAARQLIPARTALLAVEGAGHDLRGGRAGRAGSVAVTVAEAFVRFVGA